MFYTLTANPAVDMTTSCGGLLPDTNVRTGGASYTANGKGLDVSYALKKFGVDSIALGFFAGFTGKFIVDETMNMGCLCRPVWIDGITRINCYVNDGEHEYGILNPGPALKRQDQEELYKILDTAGDLDCLVVSGSLPPKATPDFLEKVMDHAQARGADVVLDLSSSKLKELAHKKPLLIKPNRHEMADIFGIEIETDDDARRASSTSSCCPPCAPATAPSLPSCTSGTKTATTLRRRCSWPWPPAPTWPRALAWVTSLACPSTASASPSASSKSPAGARYGASRAGRFL